MENIKNLISIIMTTVSYCSLYSKDHAFVDELIQKGLSLLNDIVAENQSLEMMTVGNAIIVNKNPLRDTGTHGINLIKRFKKKGISRVDFLHGITFPELKQFILNMSEAEKGVNGSAHVKTGIVDVRVGGIKVDTADFNFERSEEFTSSQVEKVKEAFYGISPFKMLNTAGIEEIVINFFLTFKKEANILKLISPVKSYSEYTYTHATNVSILSMFQAESLGISDELLHNIGIAALLHDVGKLFISNEILEKEGSLDEKEWEEIKRHTLYGARYLAKMEGLPRIAAVVALEHHLKYDGKGYPQYKVDLKNQHFISQLVGVSDFFDALRSKRPYKKDWGLKEILSIMKKNAGREFNPFLVDNFSSMLMKALHES